MRERKFKFDLSTEEKRKELYELFDSFKLKKEIYAHFGLVKNTSNGIYINEVCKEIGFDPTVYKTRKKKYEVIHCLNCGKEIITGDYRKKFCDSSCAAKYNNKQRENYKGIVENRKEKVKQASSKIDQSIIFEERVISGNHKNVGERGERIAIGELAKYDIDILTPMSDNLPFDLVVYYNNKFFKCQVKTTSCKTKNDSFVFNIESNNWYSKTIHKYTNDEVDVFILCDLNNIYLLKFDEVEGKSNFIIRNSIPKNGCLENVNFASDYIISEKRIKEVFS